MTKNNYFTGMVLIVFLYVLSACQPENRPSPERAKDARPSILFIVADDLGKDVLRAYNPAAAATPHLDFWANHGRKFNNFYVTSPVCSPSRASMLTGYASDMNDVDKILKPSLAGQQPELASNLPTIASTLKTSGYVTALIGKWHLGYRPENHPRQRGFDLFKGFLAGHIDYISHVDSQGEFGLMDGEEAWIPEERKHLTQLLTDEAITFIQQSDRAEPYFLMLSYATPHRPYLLPGEEAIFPGKSERDKDQAERYTAMVQLLDEEIGRLQAVLEARNENTLVVFISDNGAAINAPTKEERFKGKSTLFEGGINVPAFLYWPGKIAATSSSEFFSALDLYPTFSEIAGAQMDSSFVYKNFTLTDSCSGHEALIWSFHGVQAVRKGSWKAIFIPNNDSKITQRHFNFTSFSKHEELAASFDGYYPLLFNLAADPGESNDVALEEKTKLQELREIYQNSK
ncbi:sulfatase-like hydrolase/transferase [Lewinella cohaerens]|uniref:sulfatase-like hydrolase/transferase n=1 Tax=Lewinella cohaerens TaxID=70995 RepID=UPI00038035A0|nr:sulfatase-like hydrolase/transferase [Lewinella cohaerens]